MQTIELEIEDSYIDNVMNILKNLKEGMIQNISIKSNEDNVNTKVNFDEFSGMWKDRDIDIQTLRKDAWKK
jgi:hypothetical protein